jgi:phosphoglucosamine mutase
MGKQLFGTDGIRGVAGEPPLDRRTVHAVGLALGKDMKDRGHEGQALIGMDTRESGFWIAAELAAGLLAQGVSSRFAGVVTTPGVAFLTRADTFGLGIMISASHNPFQDNGIKVFSTTGFKLPDAEEHLVEEEVFRILPDVTPSGAGRLEEDPGLDREYLDHLLASLQTPLKGLRIVIDCGNGAASHLAPDLFRRAGAEVIAISHQPDGRNINLNCGALHVENLRRKVLACKADAGVAFDGDADRAILAAASGKIVDGDHVLLIAARRMKALASLTGNLVVATVMSNLGLERALAAEGIAMLRTPVGDKYVLEEMERRGAVLGGEQSGHVIFREYATTGDGMLTALRVFEIAASSGKSLDELTAGLAIYPQKLVNVRVRERRPLDQMAAVNAEIAACEKAFDGFGRVLVRFSGTEPLARVMVEGPDLPRVEEFSRRIADAIRAEIG